MHRFVARAAATAWCGVSPLPAFAQTAGDAAPDILVTASRTRDDGGVVRADAAWIEQRQPVTLLEVLADLPGVRAERLGGPAGPSQLSIRGGEANFTAVLIDGIRLNDPTNSEGGAFDFALLDPMLVSRVEVVRTGGSAVHGSDALAGVVQIVTRPPPTDGLDAAASGWIDSRYGGSATAMVAAGWGDGGLLGGAGHFDSGDGDPAGTLRRSQFLLRGRHAAGGWRLNLTGLHATSDATGFPRDSGGPRLAVIRARERRSGELSLAGLAIARDPAARLRPQLTLSYAEQRSDSDTPAIAPSVLDGVPPIRAANRFTRLEAIAALAADLGPLTLAGGGAVLREDGRSDGSLDIGFPLPLRFERTRVTRSGFAEATLRAEPRLTLTGALRYDRVGGIDRWTGRGALAWRVAEAGPLLFARLSNGFKLPSLYALGQPLIGNPDLAPETGRSLEAGVEWPVGAGQIGLTLFDNRFRNLIDFDAGLFRLVNRARVGTRGFELFGAVPLGAGFTARGALTHLAIDSATPLRGRPGWSGNVRLTWQSGRWEATGALRGNSRFADSSIPTGPLTTAGHVEAELGGRVALTERVSLRLTFLNLGDTRRWTAVGTPRPGRSARLTLAID